MRKEMFFPGPYRLRDQDGPPYTDILDPNGRIIATIYPTTADLPPGAGVNALLRRYETAAATARLMAAVVDLYTVVDHPTLDWLLSEEGLATIPEPQRTSLKLFLIPLRDKALAKACDPA